MPEQAGYIAIAETGPRPMIALRGDLADAGLRSAVKEIAGADVPAPLSVAGGGTVVWMSPDELLLLPADRQVDTYLAAGRQVAALDAALAGTHHLALDVSDARSVFRLTGARVGEVLAKGAPCDCSDRGFPPGRARRTHLAGLAVAIWRLDAETWEIACLRSYAHHLKAWLAAVSVPGSEVDA